MSLIWRLLSSKPQEIRVPFPDGHWITLEEALGEDLQRIILASILFLPSPITFFIIAKSWNATRSTEARASQHCESFTFKHGLSCLLCCLLLSLIDVFRGIFKTATEQESHTFHELCIDVRELLLHLLNLKLELIDHVPRVKHLHGRTGALSLASRCSILFRFIKDWGPNHMVQSQRMLPKQHLIFFAQCCPSRPIIYRGTRSRYKIRRHLVSLQLIETKCLLQLLIFLNWTIFFSIIFYSLLLLWCHLLLKHRQHFWRKFVGVEVRLRLQKLNQHLVYCLELIGRYMIKTFSAFFVIVFFVIFILQICCFSILVVFDHFW